MSERFYIDQRMAEADAEVWLDGPEAHHLLHVMRAQSGDRVILFDGTDHEFDAQLVSTHKGRARLVIDSSRMVSREAPIKLTLAVAVPKGDRARFLVEKCTELGVHCLIPMDFTRSQSPVSAKSIERLRRYTIEACKQSGRNRLMRIESPARMNREWLEESSTEGKWVSDPSATTPLNDVRVSMPGSVAVIVGPEGGMTEDELGAAHSCGWQAVSLGPRRLRVETAAVAIAALINLRSTRSA